VFLCSGKGHKGILNIVIFPKERQEMPAGLNQNQSECLEGVDAPGIPVGLQRVSTTHPVAGSSPQKSII
jgi:hypothetical protein